MPLLAGQAPNSVYSAWNAMFWRFGLIFSSSTTRWIEGQVLLDELGHLVKVGDRRMGGDRCASGGVLRPEPERAESSHRQAAEKEFLPQPPTGEAASEQATVELAAHKERLASLDFAFSEGDSSLRTEKSQLAAVNQRLEALEQDLVRNKDVRKLHAWGASGLTQERLAEKASISPRYLQELEIGTRLPSLKVIEALRKTLRCSWDELLGP